MDPRECASISGWVWSRARSVELQAPRVATAATAADMGAEAELCVTALAGLRRACAMADELAVVRAALVEFDLAVPRLKDGRDILEHWDAYQRNQGDLQDGGRRAKSDNRGDDRHGRRPLVSQTPGLWFSDDGAHQTVHIDGLIEVNLTTAAEAAAVLAAAVLEAISP